LAVFAVFAGCRGCVVLDTQLGQVESVRVEKVYTSDWVRMERFRVFFTEVENATNYKMEFIIHGENDFVIWHIELTDIEPEKFMDGVYSHEIVIGQSYAQLFGRQPGNTISVTIIAIDDTDKFTQSISEFTDLEIENEGIPIPQIEIIHLSVTGELTFFWHTATMWHTFWIYRNDELIGHNSLGIYNADSLLWYGADGTLITINAAWVSLAIGEVVTVEIQANARDRRHFNSTTIKEITVSAEPFDIDNL